MAGSEARRIALGALALACSLGGAARADVFSPGPLARNHQQLEGLANCTKCHDVGRELRGDRCLACHLEISDRIARGQGFHGRIPESERACQHCHHEHHGRDFDLIDWGPKGRDAFDHAKTGWALRGKHAHVACQKCHQTRFIEDQVVRGLLDKHPGFKTWLGVSTACTACHADEHRGQEGSDCKRCHVETSWKPARSFDHSRTSYPLLGKHAHVACQKCHARVQDPAPHPGLGPTFVRYVPVAHSDCIDCHKDPHQGRFAGLCSECHTPQDWKRVSGNARERAFHEKTRYPLRGAHRTVACDACHTPAQGTRSKFKGIPFAACTDCHIDSHVGQLGRTAQAIACDRCHTVDGFLPARFELEEHARTRYPLEGAHRAVACERCHRHDSRLAERVPASVRALTEHLRRKVLVSPAVLSLGEPGQRCETCHADVHGGQFAGRPGGCGSCHSVVAFAGAGLRFDHAQTRFPLTGKHARTACASCHLPSDNPRERPVRYRPLETTCSGCHADPHDGQFAARGGTSADCARCHGTESWKKLIFVHEPPFTPFRLEGKHVRLKCIACHLPVGVGNGIAVVHYKPLPTACEGCHVDFHKGAFRGFEP